VDKTPPTNPNSLSEPPLNDNKIKGKQLSKQLIRAILSVYMVIAIVITGAQLTAEFHQEKNNLKAQIETLANTFKLTITEALWNYDNEQLSASLEGIYRNQEVFGIAIRSEDQSHTLGNTLDKQGVISYRATLNDDLTKSLVENNYAELYKNELVLYSPETEGEKIGNFIIYSSSVTVFERTYATLLITLFSALVKTTGLWIIAILIINRWVARPIDQLSQHIIKLDLNSSETPTLEPLSAEQLRNKNELAFLETSFYSLCHELSKKNRLVEDHTKNLEQKIAQRTETLNRALQDLETANHAKRDFISNMGHELRTPLNSIIGMSCVLLKKTSATKDRQILNIIKESGDSLLFIINDILDYSRLDSGQLELNPVEFDLAAQLDRTLSLFTEQACSKRIPLNCNIAANVPELITSDDVRINQILVNLIGNAYKFTHEGQIELNIEKVQMIGENKIKLRFNLIDSGIGIKEHQIPHLFKAFTQAEQSTTRNYGGTGLGLNICETLTGLLGGKIGATSNPTQGSTFWFTLIASYRETQPDFQIPGAQHKQIILIATNTAIKRHFTTLCSAYKLHLEIFENSVSLIDEIGQQSLQTENCLAFAYECSDQNIFDSPEWPALSRQFQKTPKLMLGYFDELPDTDTIENEEEFALVPYPLSVRNILKGIQNIYLRKSEQGKKYHYSNNGKLSALIVDDNLNSQKVVIQMLENIGIPAIGASDGANAIEQIQQRKATFPLIIMDYEMPQMDGIETTKRIRRWEEKQGNLEPALIIALSAYDDSKHQLAAYKAGMNGYLIKPVTLEKLEHYISQQLVQRKTDKIERLH